MSVELSEKAMLVTLSIQQWTARKLDKQVTKEVNESHGAKEDAGRYNKLLIADDAIKRISQIATEARTFHYERTLPWLDTGARILPADLFAKYSEKMREYRAKFEAAVNDLVDNYPALVENARIRLNGLFKQADYPAINEIRSKYGYETAIMPLPDAADFRVTLAAGEVKKIKAEIEGRTATAKILAVKDCWERIQEAVGRIAERLNDPENVFRDSLVDNIRDLADLLPALNITGDKELDKVAKQIKAKLCKHDPQTLRDDKPVRKEVAKDADSILKAMAGFMGR